MFFLLSGRPNLRRNVRELMSAELVGEMDGEGRNRRCFGDGRKRGIGVRMKERGCQGLSAVVSA